VHDDGRTEYWDARYLVDATGRDTFMATQLKAKQRNKKHNSAAMYAHFTGARRETGKREGDISIFWFDHGWFWFIPLADGIIPAWVPSRGAIHEHSESGSA